MPVAPSVAFGDRVASVPPQVYFLGSAVFHYLGPAFAVLLFARVDVLGVAWLRIASAALIFALWRRPWRKFLVLDRNGQTLIVALGAVFAVMNASFYFSIDRLPLATVAAIEFIGPIALAVIGARVGRNFAAVAAASGGVYLLTHVRFVGEPVGVAFAFANAVLFMAYIVLAHRVARRSALGGVDGLAAAMLCGFVFVSPIGLAGAAPAFADPVALAAGVGVGVSSSVIPYVFDQLAMARLPRATYALFVALLPATATVIGILVLHQLPSLVDLAGIALVMIGVVLHRPDPDDRGCVRASANPRKTTREKPCSRAGRYRFQADSWSSSGRLRRCRRPHETTGGHGQPLSLPCLASWPACQYDTERGRVDDTAANRSTAFGGLDLGHPRRVAPTDGGPG